MKLVGQAAVYVSYHMRNPWLQPVSPRTTCSSAITIVLFKVPSAFNWPSSCHSRHRTPFITMGKGCKFNPAWMTKPEYSKCLKAIQGDLENLCVFCVTSLSSLGQWAKVHWGHAWKVVNTPQSTRAWQTTASWPSWSRSGSWLTQCQRRKLCCQSCRHHKLWHNLCWGWMPTWPKATYFNKKFCGL